MKLYIGLLLSVLIIPFSSNAQLARRGGGTRVDVQNRSANVNRNTNMNRNVNVNRNANVNVNRNANVNVNRNVNVDVHGGGCWNCGYYHDNDWNWGSFAAGAAVGAVTTAAVASAHHSSTTVVVAAPTVGTLVPTLPTGCTTISTAGAQIYQCSSIYYQPFYQGTQLVYQVVTHP
jgi:hypothetical protein